jgi:uncharacterized protein (DUF2461 family)
MESEMSFQGFGLKALPFFKALAFHQSKEWFEENRETYETAIKGPMGDLVEDVAQRLASAKIPIKATVSPRRSESIATCAFLRTRTRTRPTPASC